MPLACGAPSLVLREESASADGAIDARSRYAVARQEAVYSGAAGLIWRQAVYERLHQGWELANIGGLPFLDFVARTAQLGPQSRVLEFGSGAGAACQYLVRTTGCRATGVERNAQQAKRASERTAGSPEGDRLTFVRGEITSWRSDQDFDVTFLLDTLSLVPEANASLRAAASALRRGGWIFIADLGVTPRANSRILDRAYLEDGFCSLLSADETKVLLARRGFGEIRSYDRTDQARHALRSIVEWLQNPPASVAAAIATDVISDWLAVNRFYMDAFETGALEYRWCHARLVTAKSYP
jgi:sarcosine/dimethylglycine N-methyltransferase